MQIGFFLFDDFPSLSFFVIPISLLLQETRQILRIAEREWARMKSGRCGSPSDEVKEGEGEEKKKKNKKKKKKKKKLNKK